VRGSRSEAGLASGLVTGSHGVDRSVLVPRTLLTLQRQIGNRAIATMLHPSAVPSDRSGFSALPSGPITVQRVVAQIEPAKKTQADMPRIGKIHIVGRPESPHTSTMGDHTTAYAAQVASLILRLNGTTYPEAVAALDGLFDSLKTLPGYKLVDNLPPDHHQRFDAAVANSIAVRKELDVSGKDEAHFPLLLQQYVAAYLDVRELLPLSTINVRAKSPPLAGKGKGESTAAFVGAKTPQELSTAIMGMFDASAVGIAAAESTDLLATIAPGLDRKLNPRQRAELMVEQHLLAVEITRPEVFKKEGVDRAKLADQLLAAALARAVSCIQDDLNALDGIGKAMAAEELRTSQEIALLETPTLRRNALNGKGKLGNDMRVIKEKRASNDRNVQILVANLDVTSKLADGHAESVVEKARQAALVREAEVTRPPLKDVDEVMEVDRDTKTQVTTVDEIMDVEKDTKTQGTEVEEAEGVMEVDTPKGQADATAIAIADIVTADDDDERRQVLGVQIVIKAQKIDSIEFAGRSPSPFPGTMGAHSTSWVVHLDALRTALVGKDLTEALSVVRTKLFPEAQELEQSRRKWFDIRGEHEVALTAAKDTVEATLRHATLPGLEFQALLRQLLTYENYIPGSTLESADTGGKTEGTHRGVLLRCERGEDVPVRALVVAKNGLLAEDRPQERSREALRRRVPEVGEKARRQAGRQCFEGRPYPRQRRGTREETEPLLDRSWAEDVH
jgi:hypothetical protein